jgi:hypothetical protein
LTLRYVPDRIMDTLLRGRQMREYDDVTKEVVVSDFLGGIGVMDLSRKYEIPKSTLQGWIKNATHHHLWRVESPNGPQSKGKCVVCKTEKFFPNSITEFGWPLTPAFKAKPK